MATLEGILQDLLAQVEHQHELDRLKLMLDQRSYFTQKMLRGEAITDKGAYYQAIAGGATWGFAIQNPTDLIWIAHMEGMRVSQQGVFTLQIFKDNLTIPYLTIPRVCDFDFDWIDKLPYDNWVQNVSAVSWTNNDANLQWVAAAWIGTYIRKEVWERDMRVMKNTAEKYCL